MIDLSRLVRFSFWLSLACVVGASLIPTIQAQEVTIDADQFTSYQLLNSDHADRIQNMTWTPANLTGLGAFQDPDNNNKWTRDPTTNGLPKGWFEYSFTIATAGWYAMEYEYDWRVHGESNGVGWRYTWILDAGTADEYRLDPSAGHVVRLGSASDPIGRHRPGYVYLTAGQHTIRTEHWVKWGHHPLTRFIFTPSSLSSLDDRVSVSINPYVKADPDAPGNGDYVSATLHYMRPTESFDIKVVLGDASDNGTTFYVHVVDTNNNDAMVAEYPLDLQGAVAREHIFTISGNLPEGDYALRYFKDTTGTGQNKVAVSRVANLASVTFKVIDTTPVDITGNFDDLSRTLVQAIDCAAVAPDYVGGQNDSEFGALHRVVADAQGVSYRETGNTGYGEKTGATGNAVWLATAPNWFAYTLNTLEQGKVYEIEVDCPDDAARSTVVKLAEADPLYYLLTTGVDMGFEFPNTYTSNTVRMFYYPRSTQQPRLVIQNIHTNWRSAASAIRVYEVTDLPFMKVNSDGRRFVHWFEEPDRWTSPFGSERKGPGGESTDEGRYQSAERWMKMLRHLGVSEIFFTCNAYSQGWWPSRKYFVYNAGGVFTKDTVKMLLMLADKYGIKMVASFHPRGDELQWARAMAGDPDPFAHLGQNKDGLVYTSINYQGQSYDGVAGSSSVSPKFTPTHPTNRQWFQGAMTEFVSRYHQEPALAGVALRVMTHANSGLNNWHDLTWGYDDYTAGQFASDTGIADPGTPQARYDTFTNSTNKQTWIDWRISQADAFNAGLVAAVQAVDPQLQVYSHVFFTSLLTDFGTTMKEIYDEAGMADHNVSGFTYVAGSIRHGRKIHASGVEVREEHILKKRQGIEPDNMRALSGQSRAMALAPEYLEDGGWTIPSADLGLSYGRTWTSAHVPPAGRYNLERYALALAYTDANLLLSGGNSNFLDQANTRSFMFEYRQLPRDVFNLVPGNTIDHQVVVRALHKAGTYYFYLVNTTNAPYQVELTWTGEATFERLSSGGFGTTANQTVEVTLEPFELQAFKTTDSATITSVAMWPGQTLYHLTFDDTSRADGQPGPLTYKPTAQDRLPTDMVIHRLPGADALSDNPAAPHVVVTEGVAGAQGGKGFSQDAHDTHGSLNDRVQTGWVTQNLAGPTVYTIADTSDGLTVETIVKIDQFMQKSSSNTGRDSLVAQWFTNRTDFTLMLADPQDNGVATDAVLRFRALYHEVDSTPAQAQAIIADGQFHHIAGVIRRHVGVQPGTGLELARLELYLDGTLVGTSADFAPYGDPRKSRPDTMSVERIGLGNDGRSVSGDNGNDRGFEGTMDAAAIATTALDETNFVLTTSSAPTQSILYKLNFDALVADHWLANMLYSPSAGDILPDSSLLIRLHGNDPQATANAVPQVIDTTGSPQGQKGFVQYPPSAGHANDRTLTGWITQHVLGPAMVTSYQTLNGLTLEAIVRVDAFGENVGVASESIISQNFTNRTDFHLAMTDPDPNASGSTPVLQFNAHGQSIQAPLGSVDIVGDGLWHHLAGVIRRNVGLSPSASEMARLELYLDGQLLASLDYDMAIVPKSAPDTIVLNRIGFGNNARGGYGNTGTDRGFQGAMDASSISAQALSPQAFALPVPANP